MNSRHNCLADRWSPGRGLSSRMGSLYQVPGLRSLTTGRPQTRAASAWDRDYVAGLASRLRPAARHPWDTRGVGVVAVRNARRPGLGSYVRGRGPRSVIYYSFWRGHA